MHFNPKKRQKFIWKNAIELSFINQTEHEFNLKRKANPVRKDYGKNSFDEKIDGKNFAGGLAESNLVTATHSQQTVPIVSASKEA